MAHNIALAVQSIKSIDDSNEVGSDEPYVLVTAANLKGLMPQVEVTLYGPWGDVDKGETHGTIVIPPNLPAPVAAAFDALGVTRKPFWALDNATPAPIARPEDVVFLISVMENDDGTPAALRSLVKGVAIASLNNSLKDSREQRIIDLIDDVSGILGLPTGAPNFDDIVGTRELKLAPADLVPPASMKRVKTLDFFGGKEGTFRVAVEMAFQN